MDRYLIQYLFHFGYSQNPSFIPHTASVLSRVTCIQTNLDEEPEAVRDEFHNFLAKVISNWTDKRDQEELSIMNTWHWFQSEEPRDFYHIYCKELGLFVLGDYGCLLFPRKKNSEILVRIM